jgi:hypothetical protein
MRVEQNYAVRGIFILFAVGGAMVVFARSFAYWQEWEPRSLRISGLIVMLVGVLFVFDELGPLSALKALLGAGLTAGAYIWQDVLLERKDELRQEAERERLLDDLDREKRQE